MARAYPRHLRFLLFAWIVSRVDVIDRPRPSTMDLKDGLFLGPGEMVHLRLHNRDAAGRYSLGLGGIELVSHADVKGAGDHVTCSIAGCECAGILKSAGSLMRKVKGTASFSGPS